jgi:Flp pilus assembly protein TadD
MPTGLRQAVTALMVAISISACAVLGDGQPELGKGQISTAMLLDESPLARGFELEDTSQIDILGLSPQMDAFVSDHVEENQGSHAKLQDLLSAVMGGDEFEVVYDDRTRTARETFQERHGNCLSFTNMFVALAREAGLDARYQEVEIPPLWALSGQSLLLNRHINVHIRLESGVERVVDFNISDYNTNSETRIIPDSRARAHYFNNIGAEEMLVGDTQLALANFRQSILEDTSFSAAWVNLGNLYRRDGYAEYAEAAYLRGLEIDGGDLVAMSNLANLYQEQGYTELAAAYTEKVRTHRMQNPYYLFQLATESFVGGDYAAAIKHMKHAILLRDDEPRFYSLLSFSYLMSGDREAARRSMEKAEAVAEKQDDEQRYHQKLIWLMSRDSAD